VEEGSPATNYGAATLIGTDASPGVETFLRFDVTGLTGTVSSARLRLYASNGSADGPAVYPTGTGWAETGLTWASRPPRTGPASDDRGSVGKGAWVEFDVTPLVAGNGSFSFTLAQPGTDGADFNSREAAANRPELVLTLSGGEPPPPDTTSPTKPAGLTAQASPGRVELAWQPATDDVGVTGYDLFRENALLVSLGPVLAYTDTTVAGNTTYAYEVRARDAAGNVSPRSDAVQVTTPAAPSVFTFAPVADARVQEAKPATNYGSSGLRTDGGPAVETYLRFDLGALPGQLQSARLRLYATAGSVDGPAVYPTGSAWTETALTWASRPARTGPASDDRGALPSGAYAEWDVTALVPASGLVSFVLAQTSTDGMDFSSREAVTNRPQLVVTVTGEAPPQDTSAPSKPVGLSAAATGGRVDLAWQAATDNVGVTGYDVFRNDALLASLGAVTSYADTAVAGNTIYTYEVRARDAVGNVSARSDPATATTPDAPTVLTLSPVADSRMQEANPSTNYGTATLIGADAGPAVETVLRFDLSGVGGTVQSARLRLWATNGSVDGPAVFATSSGWTETGVTWANRPARVGSASDDLAVVTAGGWVELDVKALVLLGGPISLLLAQAGTDGADFSSREATTVERRPQLVVTLAP